MRLRRVRPSAPPEVPVVERPAVETRVVEGPAVAEVPVVERPAVETRVVEGSDLAAPVVAAPLTLGPRRRGRGIVLAALALSVLLVLAAVALARARRGADILGLGATPTTAGLSAADDAGVSVDGQLDVEPSGVAPGDSVPGAPAAADPAAPGAPAAPGEPVGPPAAAGGGAGAGGGAAAPASFLPVLTTRVAGSVPSATGAPGGGGGGGGGGPGGGTPPPGPRCTITQATVTPNPVTTTGNSGRLSEDVTVSVQTADCGSATFQVAVNGLTLAAAPSGDGRFSAVVDKAAATWDPGTYPGSVTGGGTSRPFSLVVQSPQQRR